jgi:hypothetical protein
MAVALLFVLGSSAEAQPLPDDTRGYVSRACGFDMNDNGVAGEAADCNVCDGVTTDPDGDGDPEDLIYVDCNSGSDSGNGTPGNPYRTLAKALSTADGASDGREDIICARATCSAANGSRVSEQDIPVSGVANKGPTGNWFYTRPRRGPEERDFQYPADPVMIVGWDTDDDGDYPPFDSDQPEPLVFDACSAANCSGGTTTAIGFRTRSDRDYIEFAHFTMKNYGRGGGTPSASISLSGSGSKAGIYLHDLVIEKPNYRLSGESDRAAIYVMMGGASLTWFAIENVKIFDYGSWPIRGNLGGSYYRFRNLELFGPKPSSGENSPGFKVWEHSNTEYLGIKFDSDIGNIGVSDYGQIAALQLSKSSSNVVFRNNIFRNCNECMIMDYRDCDASGQTYCSTANGQTTTRNVLMDRQVFTQDASVSGNLQFLMVRAIASDGSERGGGDRLSDPNCTDPVGFENLTIKNSVFMRTTGRGGAMQLKIGSNCAGAPLGPVTIDNNTFVVSPSGRNSPLINVGGVGAFDYDYRYYAQSYRIRNNTVSGVDGGDVVFQLKHQGENGYFGDTRYPSDFVATGNAYGSAPAFVRDGTSYSSLSSWQSATRYDTDSDSCSTRFAADGYRLLATDTCSKDQGVNTACTTSDIDGRARVRTTADPCDRGADEEGNGGAPPPDPDTTPLAAPVLREALPVPTR